MLFALHIQHLWVSLVGAVCIVQVIHYHALPVS